MTSLLLCCLSALAAVPAPLAGEWEGEVALPGRPLVVHVDFPRKQAQVDLTGSQLLPLQQLQVEGARVRFQLSVGGLAFDGTRDGDSLRGSAQVEGKPVPFALRQLPTLPAPEGRVQAWEQDLQQVVERFLVYERSFSPKSRERFREAVARLRGSLAKKSDPEIIVELARAVALAGNAHTRLYLLRNRTELRRLPLRVWWFADGLYVVKATPEQQDTLGCRVTRIEGRAPEALKDAVAGVFAGPRPWQDYMSTYSLTSTEVLFGSHLIPDMEQVRFSFACGPKTLTRALRPLPLVKKERPTEAWWDLTPGHPSAEAGFVGALEARKVEPPLALREPGRHYSFELLEGPQLLYFRYSRAQEMPGEPLAAFGEKLLATFREQPVKALVVDLRFNTGGNLYLASELMERLQQEATRKGAKVFVLMGRSTFSAGIAHVAQWSQWGHATLVGEPVGDVIDMWAEGGNVVLPNSKLFVHYANGFHAWSKREYPERKPYFYDLGAPDVDPDLPVRATSRDYFSGRDAELEAVLSAAAARR